MTRFHLHSRIGLWLLCGASLLSSASVMGDQATDLDNASVQSALYGTWTGELHSKHAGTAPSALTIAIEPGPNNQAVANATISSGCLAGSNINLEVSIEGETVSLAGSDNDGNSLTVQGTLDKTGAILTSNAAFNGSATGRCELDTGSGTLIKQ